DDGLQRWRELSATTSSEPQGAPMPNDDLQRALDDDLNISGALGVLFESIRETNRAMAANDLGPAAAKAWLQWWDEVNRVLGLDSAEAVTLPAEIEALAEARRLGGIAKRGKKEVEL